MLPLYSCQINEILNCDEPCAQRIVMLLDQYDCADAQEEFVAALVHRLLVEHARNQATVSKLRLTNSSTVHSRSVTPAAIAGVQRSVR